MSRDSSATYLHMHSPHLADHFEDFCRPPTSSSTTGPSTFSSSNLLNQNPSNVNNTNNTATNPSASTHTATNGTTQQQQQQPGNPNTDNMAQLPGHFLPFEEIQLPPHLMPINPEDEDDVVPDMHAAFGINRALGQGVEGSGGGGVFRGEGQAREPAWRDFGLDELVRRGPVGGSGGERLVASGGGGGAVGVGVGMGGERGRRDGKRTGLMMMR